MIYAEKKLLPHGFEYTCNDVFGQIVIESPQQLGATELDACVIGIMGSGTKEGTLDGVLKNKDAAGAGALAQVRYRFDPAPMWSEDEDGPELSKEKQGRVLRRRRWAAIHSAFLRFWREVVASLKP